MFAAGLLIPVGAPAQAQAQANPPPRPQAVTDGRHPNVLVIIADDLGWNGVGFHRPTTPTPNLNRLAKEGLEVQRFYTYPVCSPTRAALLTGRMPRRFGIVDALNPRQAGIPANTPTLPEAFRAAGYQTSLIGKWHLGQDNPPMKCGFDHFYGFMGSQIDYYNHTNPRGDRDWQRDGKALVETGYSSYLLADEAVRQIIQRDAKRPFFMEVAFNAPHIPLAAPAELVAKHANDGGLYIAVIEAMDIAIGRILTALDAQGLRDNTLVVFFSDNGGGRRFIDNDPLAYGKDTIYEGGIHTPCVIRWPGKLPAGGKSGQPIAVNDFLPTLAAAANLPGQPAMITDGSNQWPALQSGKTLPRPPVVIASHDIALIDGEWKLIEWESGKYSLFNLATDIGETNDQLATQPELAKKLMDQLAKLETNLPAAPARREPRPGGRATRP